MTWFRVDPTMAVSPSQQIIDAILDGIAGGRFDDEPKLPSVRNLAVEVLVNPNTVSKAYLELERLGVTRARSGSGVFVTEGAREIAQSLRHEATLWQFEAAVHAARSAGHTRESLVARVDQQFEGKGGSVRSPQQGAERTDPERTGGPK